MNQPDNNGFEWDDISSDSQFVVGGVERTEVKKDKKTCQNKEKKVREKTAQIPTQKTKKDMEKGSACDSVYVYGACAAHGRNRLVFDI